MIANPNWRTQIKEKESDSTIVEEEAVGPLAWQASFRSGAGMSIAALASTMENDGNFTRQQYLQTAEDAVAFLQKNNLRMVNDGKENIVDDYTALLEYARIAQQANIRQTVKRSLSFELAVTKETCNPFGYARQLLLSRTTAKLRRGGRAKTHVSRRWLPPIVRRCAVR